MSISEKSIWVDLRFGDEDARRNKFIGSVEAGFHNFFCLPEDVSKLKKLGNAKIAAFAEILMDDSKSDDLKSDFLESGCMDSDSLKSDFRESNCFESDCFESNCLKSDVLILNLKDFCVTDSCITNSCTTDSCITDSCNLNFFSSLNCDLFEIGVFSNFDKSATSFIISNADFLDYAFIEPDDGDWKIIPFENLRAETWDRKVKIIACLKDVNDAKIASEILESGVDGVLIDCDVSGLSEIKSFIENNKPVINFNEAVVESVEFLGSGDRVCVDTCHILNPDEGMLVGSSSDGFFLVLSEATDTVYSSARPFRVNAGAVFSYIITDSEKTKYLSEIKAGDSVLIVNTKGSVKNGIAGRAKIEKRPLVLIKAKAGKKTVSAILQNAETVKIAGSNGNSIPVTEIKPGDKVFVHMDENSARHFGIKIKESIIEK